KVVMTPAERCYLDFGQGNPQIEPPAANWAHRLLRLRDCYGFEPAPAGVDAGLVMGGQGNLWTELVSTPSHVEYMTWPRGCALAEALWTPAAQRDWDRFVRNVIVQMPRWKSMGVQFSPSLFDPSYDLTQADGTPRIILNVDAPGLDLFYTFD